MKIIVGDILKSGTQTIVNTVNCVGVMGKGIALEFKKRFPEMFADYVARCRHGEVKPGVPYLFKSLLPPRIVNFPTKDHWKSVSRISDLEHGLRLLLANYQSWGVTSLAIPPLGCGNGQLEWREVGPLIYKYAGEMKIPVEIYAPYGTPARQLTAEFLSQPTTLTTQPDGKLKPVAVNPAWIALIEILRRLEEQPYHWPVGRVIFQKIAYIATRQGLPTGFVYQRGSFGPFSKELKKAETVLVNDNLLQEEKIGSMFRVKVGPNFPKVRKEYSTSLTRWAEIIERVTDLFLRMNTEQSEIVATVVYAADSLTQEKNEKPSEPEVLKSVMQWKQKRRPKLDQAVVASTIQNLGMLRWVEVRPAAGFAVSEEEFASV